MTSRSLLDPDFSSVIGKIPRFSNDPARLGLERELILNMSHAIRPETPDVEVSEGFAGGLNGAPPVRLLVCQPKTKSADRPAILHLHGGGFMMGAPETGLATHAAYVKHLGAVVISVDYRLAPEAPYPSAIDDCYAALTWLFDQADELGVDRTRIAVSGESAGGGLAAALGILARDRGQFSLAFQHLIFPMLDDRTAVATDPSPHVGQFVWTAENNYHAWSAFLGEAPGGPNISPYAAPARAINLARLPPTFIACGALDLFVGENLDFAGRLIRQGVPTEVHIYPGAPHVFVLAPGADQTRSFLRDSMNAFKKVLRVGV